MINIDDINKYFQKNGTLYLKQLIDKNLCVFLTHYLLRKSSNPDFVSSDGQVVGTLSIADHDPVFETLLEKLWPEVELASGMNLIPTYAYARLYKNGNILEKHSDRPECEISLTLQLGRSHHYSWPIWMEGYRYDLSEGDGILYKGCELEHWRDECDGPQDYYSGQVFLHYVNADGPYADRAYDIKTRKTYENMFMKYRDYSMEKMK